MSKVDDYNRRELEAGRITYEHLDELIRFTSSFSDDWHPGEGGFEFYVKQLQREKQLVEDGMLGPLTRAKLVDEPASPAIPLNLEPILIDSAGWVSQAQADIMPADSSWFYHHDPMKPIGVVCHFTATGPGSGKTMALRRMGDRTGQRAASWHLTVEPDGTIIQMVSLVRGAWHCRATAENKKLLGNVPNRCTIGIELVSKDGKHFPAAQVNAYARLLRAIVRKYKIPRNKAMLLHSELDPGRRSDPGPVWERDHAERVVQYAFADLSF